MRGKKVFAAISMGFLLIFAPSIVAMKPAIEDKNLLFDICAKGDINLVAYLLENGLNINSRDYYGWTLLHIACLLGNKDLVVYLIEHGADPYGLNGQNVSSAQIALSKGHAEIADYIIASLKPNREKLNQIERLKQINTGVNQKIAAAEHNYGIFDELENSIPVKNLSVIDVSQKEQIIKTEQPSIPVNQLPNIVQSEIHHHKTNLSPVQSTIQPIQTVQAARREGKRYQKKNNARIIQAAPTAQPQNNAAQTSNSQQSVAKVTRFC